jgi:hypothetical protein
LVIAGAYRNPDGGVDVAQCFGVVLGKIYPALGSPVSIRNGLEPTDLPSRKSSTV